MKDFIIEARDLYFAYPANDENPDNKTKAVTGLSVNIPRGCFTAIIGHNGSGKSTLAKLISGILLADKGSVLVYKNHGDDGLDPADESNNFEIRKTVGMVFQNPDNQLVATIVEDDVAFAPENLGVEPGEIRRRVDDALLTVGLSEYALKDTHKLSGGQKQRVAIAGMLAMNPGCIIFDESTAMLDPKGRADIINTIMTLRDRGITVVLITHYMNEAAKADNVVLVDHGKAVIEGTPDYVFSHVDLLKECGLEAPQSSMLVNMLKNSGVDIETAGILDAEAAAQAIFDALKRKGEK